MRGVNILLIAFFIAIVSLSYGCQENSVNEDIKEPEENLTGLRVSDWYKSEKYQRDILDILNFDEDLKIINVTTVCFDNQSNVISTKDSSIMRLPGKSKWTWVPVCPAGTASYVVNILEVNETKYIN